MSDAGFQSESPYKPIHQEQGYSLVLPTNRRPQSSNEVPSVEGIQNERASSNRKSATASVSKLTNTKRSTPVVPIGLNTFSSGYAPELGKGCSASTGNVSEDSNVGKRLKTGKPHKWNVGAPICSPLENVVQRTSSSDGTSDTSEGENRILHREVIQHAKLDSSRLFELDRTFPRVHQFPPFKVAEPQIPTESTAKPSQRGVNELSVSPTHQRSLLESVGYASFAAGNDDAGKQKEPIQGHKWNLDTPILSPKQVPKNVGRRPRNPNRAFSVVQRIPPVKVVEPQAPTDSTAKQSKHGVAQRSLLESVEDASVEAVNDGAGQRKGAIKPYKWIADASLFVPDEARVFDQIKPLLPLMFIKLDEYVLDRRSEDLPKDKARPNFLRTDQRAMPRARTDPYNGEELPPVDRSRDGVDQQQPVVSHDRKIALLESVGCVSPGNRGGDTNGRRDSHQLSTHQPDFSHSNQQQHIPGFRGRPTVRSQNWSNRRRRIDQNYSQVESSMAEAGFQSEPPYEPIHQEQGYSLVLPTNRRPQSSNEVPSVENVQNERASSNHKSATVSDSKLVNTKLPTPVVPIGLNTFFSGYAPELGEGCSASTGNVPEKHQPNTSHSNRRQHVPGFRGRPTVRRQNRSNRVSASSKVD